MSSKGGIGLREVRMLATWKSHEVVAENDDAFMSSTPGPTFFLFESLLSAALSADAVGFKSKRSSSAHWTWSRIENSARCSNVNLPSRSKDHSGLPSDGCNDTFEITDDLSLYHWQRIQQRHDYRYARYSKAFFFLLLCLPILLRSQGENALVHRRGVSLPRKFSLDA